MSVVLISAPTDPAWEQHIHELSDPDLTLKLFHHEEPFLQAARDTTPDALVLGTLLPSLKDMALITQLRSGHPELPIVLVAADPTPQLAFQCARAGASHLHAGSFSSSAFLVLLKQALEEGARPATAPGQDRQVNGQLLPYTVPSLREVIHQHIETALNACQGNRSRTAKLLGIDRSTLRRRLADIQDTPKDEA